MISIIIPCYNHEALLKNSVASALAQTYADKQIIVVDDGSVTPVQNVWGDTVRVIRHRQNKGLSAALNTGISASTGDRFVILAADDMLHANHLEVLSKHDADVVSCDMKTPTGIVRGREASLKLLAKANCHSYAALIKKHIWQRVGGYNVHMNPSWEDWEFFLSAAKYGATFNHVSAPLHIYNRAPNGRDAEAQGKDILLWGKMHGFHQDLYGKGRGIVAFITPCYNHEQYLKNAVSSALKQTYPHVKVVIIDDGSPGNVLEALKDLPGEHLTVIRQRNKHLSAARNAGIKAAIAKYNAEYIIPLDADDEVDPNFIERLLPHADGKTYIYSDVQFIGDAWHKFTTPDFNCTQLTKKHQHACTILMNSAFWQQLVARRGFGYDESMKQGYEDWEFALALVQSGVCGKRVPEPIFRYRFHKDGSMRTDAAKINSELVTQIRIRQPWINSQKDIEMACSTCGKSRYAKVVSMNGGGVVMSYNVPGVGLVDGREQIAVTYTGSQTSTITKVAPSGTIYKYSGNPNGTFKPKFTIFARDIHLFVGAYVFARVTPEVVPAPVAVAAVALKEQVIPAPAKKVDVLTAKLENSMEVVAYEPDDLTRIKGVGATGAKKLADAGFSYFEDVADAAIDELTVVLGISKAKAQQVIDSAEALIAE